jgi:hypothetical protein
MPRKLRIERLKGCAAKIFYRLNGSNAWKSHERMASSSV